MIVVHEGRKLRLEPSSVLGTGGEATVFALDATLVAKVWHRPSAAHRRKLDLVLARAGTWPEQVVAPVAALHDARGKEIVGAVLPRIAATFAPVSTLLKRGARASYGLSLAALVELLITLAHVVEELHARGVVVGDLNDQNELWSGQEVRFLDVDSFQLDGAPCAVATESYLDPALYDVDLEAAPAFTAAHDQYALAVLAFRALVGAHPYGGTHPTLSSLPARAKAGEWIFAPGVIYPAKVAHPRAVLSKELDDWFCEVFVGGARRPFPTQLLRELGRTSVACAACGLSAPRSLAACPGCAARKPISAPAKRLVAAALIESHGEILLVETREEGVFALAAENGRLVRYRARPGTIERHELDAFGPRARAVLLRGGEVAVAHGEEVTLFDAGGERLLETTTATVDGVPVLAACGGSLCRIAGGVVLRGAIRGRHLVERALCPALVGQTWVTGGPADEDVLLGVDRIFRRHAYFVIRGGIRLDLDAAGLDDDEHETGRTMLWDGGHTIVLRETIARARASVRMDGFDAGGARFLSLRAPPGDRARAGIEGRAFRGTTLLHPTDDGVVRERLGAGGALDPIPGTEPYVASTSRLLPHPSGLLVTLGPTLFLLQTH